MHTTLPPVRKLIEDAWQLFTKKALSILLLGLLSFVVYIIFFLLFGVLLFVTGAGTVSSWSSADAIMHGLMSSSFLTVAGILLVVFVLCNIIFSIAVQAAYILLIADTKKEPSSLRSYIGAGLPFVGPLLFVSAMTTFLVMGGFFFLIIPGFIIGLFFMFVPYIVILEKKRGIEAMRLSAALMSQQFGAIVGRVILFIAVSITVQMLFTGMGQREFHNGGIGLLAFVLNIVLSWYGMGYMYLLYKQARETFDPARKTSLLWMGVLAGIGWIIAALVVVTAVNVIEQNNNLPML